MAVFGDKGNLVKDWELHGTSPSQVYRSRIAINNAVKLIEKDENGKPKYDAMFMDIVAWEGTEAFKFIQRMANAGKPTGKGSHLEFVGQLKGEQWKNKESQVMTSYFVNAFSLDFAASAARKTDGAQQGQTQSTAGNTPAPAAAPAASGGGEGPSFALDL